MTKPWKTWVRVLVYPLTTSPNLLGSDGVLYHVQKYHPLAPFLNQINPVLVATSSVSKSHSSHTHLRLTSDVFVSAFQAGILCLFLNLQCMLYVHPSNRPWFDRHNYVCLLTIPHNLWNLKVYCCIYKLPPPVPILSQIDPFHMPPSHFFNIHFNIILLSTPGYFVALL